MSIILAYKKDDTVYMATDTRVVANEVKREDLSPSSFKIQALDNGILVGVAGDRQLRQDIFAYSEIFTLDSNQKLTKRHIVTEIMPKLYEMLNAQDHLVVKEKDIPYMKAQIVLAYKGELYEICCNLMVIKYESFLGIGKSEHSLATLLNTKASDDINSRLVRALDITAKYNQGVGAPYVLIDTKSRCHTLVKEDRSKW